MAGISTRRGFDTAEADEAGRPRYTQIWAFDRRDEKRAFEELVDFITERRARRPGLHVYHYNHYEPTSVTISPSCTGRARRRWAL